MVTGWRAQPTESFYGYMVEAGGAYFWRPALTLSVGIEPATGQSTYSGIGVEVLVAAGFAADAASLRGL